MYEIKPFDAINVGDRVSISKTITEADAGSEVGNFSGAAPAQVGDVVSGP